MDCEFLANLSDFSNLAVPIINRFCLQYSKSLQKVFIDIDKVLALQFKWTVDDMKVQPEFFVRAMPVYTSHDSLKTPVTRCPIHRMPDNALNQGEFVIVVVNVIIIFRADIVD